MLGVCSAAAQQVLPPPPAATGTPCTGDFCTATAPLLGSLGGTGVANTGKTITLGGNFTTSGAFAFTATLTGATNVTFPTSGTLLTSAGAVTSIAGTANQIAASASTGAVTLSTPSDFRLPGTINLLTLTQPAAGATLTLANSSSLITSGAFAVTLTSTAATNSTLPAGTHTLAGLDVTQTWDANQTVEGLTTTSPGWYAQITGDSVPRVRVGLNPTDVASIGFGSGAGVRDLFLERAGAAQLRLGAPDAAAPVAQVLSVQNVVTGTSNTVGPNLTIEGSQGTGTGAGGSIVFFVAPAGTTGTSQNALSATLTLDSTKLATFAGKVTISGSTVTALNVTAGGITSFNDIITTGGSFTTGSSGAFNWGSKAAWTSPATSFIRAGLANNASPNGYTIDFESSIAGTSNNVSGASGTFQSGNGTGNSATSSLLFKTPVAVASGTGAQTETTQLTLNSTGATFAAQIVVANMTQTSAAQSGTVCWAAAGLTYDATLGCLASLPELKDFHGGISNVWSNIDKIKPYWFSWKNNTPEWKGGDHETQPGFNALEIASIPGIGGRLTAKGPDGKVRGVRYMEMTAYLQAEIIALKTANDNLACHIAKLEHHQCAR